MVRREGHPATEVLVEALPGLVAGLRFGKTMRWNASGVAFSRPVRWLVALLGDVILPFDYAGLTADRETYGSRPAGSPALQVSDAAAYRPLMEDQNIIVDREARRAEIARQVAALATEVGGATPDDPALLDEVTDLVEQPTAFLGDFDPEYLRLPKEVLITVMKKHQRYFPVVDAEGRMLPHFIGVRNGGSEYLDIVRAGQRGRPAGALR